MLCHLQATFSTLNLHSALKLLQMQCLIIIIIIWPYLAVVKHVNK
jgi:hypothetical protein